MKIFQKTAITVLLLGMPLAARASSPAQNCTDANESLAPTIARAFPNSALESCQIYASCPSSGRTQLWAQLQLDGDLMQDELAKLHVDAKKVHVAVVDTGFDLAGAGKFMKNPKLNVNKGFSDAGDPKDDQIGHGTAVSSLIGGANGVGLSPDAALSVYRVYQSDPDKTSLDNVKNSLRKACHDGNDVINFSIGVYPFGIVNDEGSKKNFFESDDDLVKDLREHGCLVVQAAGNAGTRFQPGPHPSGDPFVHVAATNQITQNLAAFSASGGLEGPGESVFTLKSTLLSKDEQESYSKGCPEATPGGSFVSGTSFAAPLETAVDAGVLSILKTSSTYKKLDPSEKLDLQAAILEASQHDGPTNGLRAVVIAKKWIDAGQSKVPPIETLRESISLPEDPICQKVNGSKMSCTLSAGCAALDTCVKSLRRAAALCKNISQEALIDLGLSLSQTGNFDVGFPYLKQIRKDVGNSDENQAAEDLVKRYIDRLYSYANDKNAAMELIGSSYLVRNSGSDTAKLDELARKVLTDDLFYKFKTKDPNRGGQCEKPLLLSMDWRSAIDTGFIDDRLVDSADHYFSSSADECQERDLSFLVDAISETGEDHAQFQSKWLSWYVAHPDGIFQGFSSLLVNPIMRSQIPETDKSTLLNTLISRASSRYDLEPILSALANSNLAQSTNESLFRAALTQLEALEKVDHKYVDKSALSVHVFNALDSKAISTEAANDFLQRLRNPK